MECRPVGWTVLIEEIKRENEANLIIPDSAKGSILVRHVVIAVGDPRITADGREVPIPVKVGDEVRINTEGGPRSVTGLDPQHFGGRNLFVIDAEWVKGVITGEPEKPSPVLKPAKKLIHA